MADVLDEALEMISDLPGGSYRPFDQRQHIKDWDKLVSPKMREAHPNRNKRRNEEIDTWEAAHGHDVRLKCYPEFGCLAIQYELRDLLVRLTEEIKEARE